MKAIQYACWGLISICLPLLAAPREGWYRLNGEPKALLLTEESNGNYPKATASGQWGSHAPNQAVDGIKSANNHWACTKLPATLTVDWGRVRKMTTLKLYFYYGDPRVYKFMVERSSDQKQWELVADWRENEKPSTSQGFEVALKPGSGRYLRVTVTDSSKRESGAHNVEAELVYTERLQELKLLNIQLEGRVAPLERITKENAQTGTVSKAWAATAWKNERVHGQFVVWNKGIAIPRLSCTVSPLVNEKGAVLPSSSVETRFVRYSLARGKMVGDVLDPVAEMYLPPNGFRPIWLTVKVPRDIAAGTYRGKLTVGGLRGGSVNFPLSLEILDTVLPDTTNWKFHLDLWQHPWAVARYHQVEPFSPAHENLMRPIYEELASAGQRTITTTLSDMPWNHQNYDPYYTMIEHIREKDGSWRKRDFSLFDRYVSFCLSCGLGPEIHCYTMVTWGNLVHFWDVELGEKISQELKPGTPEHEKFWGIFLKEFQAHLKEKGWLGQTYIAMDERSPQETLDTVKCIQKYAPGLKVAMAGNRPPSQFKGIEIHSYCQYIPHINPGFLKEVQERRARGLTTTFYVCCSPARPNTFSFSPAQESVWLPLYSLAKGLDGFLRWAVVNWQTDPLKCTDFRFPSGDTFLIYPGPRLSVRWELLRDGIEETEKVRWLREQKAEMAAVEKELGQYGFPQAHRGPYEALVRQVTNTRLAIEDAAKKWCKTKGGRKGCQ